MHACFKKGCIEVSKILGFSTGGSKPSSSRTLMTAIPTRVATTSVAAAHLPHPHMSRSSSDRSRSNKKLRSGCRELF